MAKKYGRIAGRGGRDRLTALLLACAMVACSWAVSVHAERDGSSLNGAERTSAESGAEASSEPSSSGESPVSSEPSSSGKPSLPSESPVLYESPVSSESSSGESPVSSGSSSGESPVSSESSSVSEPSSSSESPVSSKPDFSYTYEDNDVAVTAVPSDASALPEGAKLRVVPIKSGKAYKETEEKINERVGQENRKITGFLAYDIYFEVNGTRYEPDAGSVAVTVRYKGGLFDSKVKKATDEIRVLHLKENKVEDVTGTVDIAGLGGAKAAKPQSEEKTGPETGDTVGFVTDSFSTFVVAALTAEDAGIQFSASDILSALSPVLPFAVFAETYNNAQHMAGSIAVNHAQIHANFGSTNFTTYKMNNTITVLKQYNGSTPTNFRFGLYNNGHLNGVKELTLPFNGRSSGTVTFDVGDGGVGSNSPYSVKELDGDGNIIGVGKEGDGFRLESATPGNLQEAATNLNNVSYIQYFDEISDSHSLNNTSNVLIVGKDCDVENNVQDNRSSVYVGARTGGNYVYTTLYGIKRETTSPYIDITAVLAEMSGLSKELAQMRGTSKTVKVYNYTANEIEQLSNENNQLQYEIDDNQILLINIDASNRNEIHLVERSKMKVNGKQSGGDESVAGRVVINVFTKETNEEDQIVYSDYTGTINNVWILMGTLLAPAANVHTGETFNGRIVARYAENDNGEIHGTATGAVGQNITWTFVNKETGSQGYTLPVTGGAGNLPFRVAGAAILAGAAVGLGFRLRRGKKKKGGPPQNSP